ncbi:hypothetical protein PSH03_000751 [Micromonospora sp. PSH03]|nr:hypothetical protein [Micromonospora salmantinae]
MTDDLSWLPHRELPHSTDGVEAGAGLVKLSEVDTGIGEDGVAPDPVRQRVLRHDARQVRDAVASVLIGSEWLRSPGDAVLTQMS